MAKKILFSFWLLLIVDATTLVFNSCSKDDDSKEENNQNSQNNQSNSLTTDAGVVINGVDVPGTFAATSTAYGTTSAPRLSLRSVAE